MIPLNREINVGSEKNTKNENNINTHTTPGPARNETFNLELLIEAVFERFSQGLRIIGPMFAFALTLFVLVVTHAFFQIILPYWISKIGKFIGLILALCALFLLFNILFNYFLAVLVKPGSMEDVRKSKYYRKADPLEVSSTVINISNVFLNKANTQMIQENISNVDNKVEVKMRLKVNSPNYATDNIMKEEQLIKSSNALSGFNLSKKNESTTTTNDNTINNFSNEEFDLEDEEFSKHLDDKLTCLPNPADFSSNNINNNLVDFDENNKQEKEIDEYYNLNNNSSNINNSGTSNRSIYVGQRLHDCRTCKQHKPIRAHHCAICGYCVLKMDHHCPWINNCVGQNNHRYFILFLTHLMLGCLFVCLTSIPIVFNTNITKTMEFNFVSVLSFVGFFLMIFFNSWNWFLVIRGNTTIEFWTLKGNLGGSNTSIKDFSLNKWRDNLFLVFGTRSLLTAVFLPSIKRLPLSGLEWTKLAVPSYNFEVIEYIPSQNAVIIAQDNEEIV